MSKFLTAFVCLFAVASALYPYAEQDHIINLGDPTWGTAINEFPAGLLVYFYEPYCFPCRQMWPELHKTAQNLADAQSVAKIAKVECHDEVRLCTGQQVFSFPTLILHKGGAAFEYTGARTAEAMTTWLQQVVDFKFPTVDNEADLFSRFSTVALVNNGPPENVKQSVMGLLGEINWITAGPSIVSKLGSNSAAILTQSGDATPIVDSDNGDGIKGKVVNIFKNHNAVANANWDTFGKLRDDQSYDFIFLFRTKSFNSGSDTAKAFDKAAQDLNPDGHIIFNYANTADDLLGDYVSNLFGVSADDEPAVGIISKKGKVLSKYKLASGVTFDAIQKLVQDWQAGNAKRFYMTAEVPEVQAGHIKELVNKNYNEVTADPNLNVLVMFYFPWSEPSVKLEPTLKSLAYRLRDHSNIVIARIDATQNDVEGHDVIDFPTILFYPEGASKTVVEYKAGRNINEIKNFLFEQISTLKDTYEL